MAREISESGNSDNDNTSIKSGTSSSKDGSKGDRSSMHSNKSNIYKNKLSSIEEGTAMMSRPEKGVNKHTKHISSSRFESFVYMCTLLAAMFCLAVLGLTTANLVYMGQGRAISSSEQTAFQGVVCVQCVKLIRDPFNWQEQDPLMDKLIRQVDSGVEMCCANTTEQMSALLEAAMREQETRPHPAPHSSSSSLKFVPVSAHKQLLPHHQDELTLTEPVFVNETSHFTVTFNSDFDDPVTEHARGVKVHNTSLEVTQSGFYYIYLSVHMASNYNRPLRSHKYKSWYEFVHRTSPNNPANSMILLQTTHTPYDGSSNEATVFTAGTFYLNQGDHLEVCLCALGLVQYKKESSYFGLIMMGSKP